MTARNALISATSAQRCNVGPRAYVRFIGTNGGIMLSTVFAAEAQFRLDSQSRAREHAILESIRERSEPLTAQGPVPAPLAAVSWPRPIGVRLDLADATTVCAAA